MLTLATSRAPSGWLDFCDAGESSVQLSTKVQQKASPVITCLTVHLSQPGIDIISQKKTDEEIRILHQDHSESRWLATPKRWRFVRGHDKPRLMGVALSTFHAGVCIGLKIIEKTPQDARLEDEDFPFVFWLLFWDEVLVLWRVSAEFC